MDQFSISTLTEELKDHVVEGELDKGVEVLQLERLLGIGEEGSEGVEGRLEDDPDELAQSVAEESGLQLGRDVCVNHVVTLELKQEEDLCHVIQLVPL